MAATVETREECEVAIVGAGPAGCTAAAILAELGHDVLLIDQSDFPRDKPCGDGIGGPAVELAARLGLGALLAAGPEVRSTRIVVGHRRATEIPFAAGKGQVLPRCVPRREFDAALQAAALERGARFRRARVASLERGERRQRLVAVDGEAALTVEAGFAIAADGATSRLRRQTRAATQRPTAYAIRAYYRTEKPVEPVFRCDLPVEVDGRILPGYGWVFPIDEHTVNVGVGSNYIPHQEVPSLRRVLDIYVDQLRTKSARQVGDLEAIGPPLGSPVGVRRRIEIAGDPGLALVGDAAGTTSPITGEGISFAMRGAEELARELHRKDRRPASAPPAVVEGNVWRAFPQVGIDTSAAIRVATLRANQAPSAAASVRSPAGPFLEAIWRMLPKSAYGTGIAQTPAWAALSDCDRALGASLERINDLLLERLADPMPFVTEVIHDSIRGHLGPMYAAAVLATAAGGAEDAGETADAGISAEVVGVLPKLLTMLVDRASSRQLKLNNAWAVLAGDFAATRSLSAAAKLGPAAVSALSRACQRGCAGGMLDTAARYAPDRTPESWLEAARETEGSAMVLATEFGAMVMGEDAAAAAPLREFGLELGVAVRLAEEIVELCGTAGDGGEAGAHTLDRGIYSLPVLYATRVEPALSRLLVQHAAEGDRGEEVVRVVTESGALDRAVSECGERAERARACAESWTANDGRALAALASLPLEYVAARTSADASSACR